MNSKQCPKMALGGSRAKDNNCQRLVASAKPVLRCHAKHNHTEAKKAKSDDADGLEKEVLLAEGAKVMLTCNL
jgi:hypothetical protein